MTSAHTKLAPTFHFPPQSLRQLICLPGLCLLILLMTNKANANHQMASIRFDQDRHYYGYVRDGFPHGQGTLSFPDGGKYVGEWKNGKANGHGIFFFSNGDRYEGNFENGNRNGEGIYIWNSGQYYKGEFLNGRPCKTGVRYSKDEQDHFQWKKGNSGTGTMTKQDGTIAQVKWGGSDSEALFNNLKKQKTINQLQ